MNYRIVGKLLGIICLLIGISMILCLPWAWKGLGHHTDSIVEFSQLESFEWRGFFALSCSTLICFAVSGLFFYLGRKAKGQIFLREAMAIVGLSWVLATVLGAMPFMLSKTYRGCSIRVYEDSNRVFVSKFNWNFFDAWSSVEVSSDRKDILQALVNPNGYPRKAQGLNVNELAEITDRSTAEVETILENLLCDETFSTILLDPESPSGPFPNNGRYRLRWIRMGLIDSLFESQSGFSTTGATVIGHLEDPELVSHCILFWRSVTHFLGGLGIIVLFVVVLGEGSAGKALMRNEVPGPIDSNPTTRMRHAALLFTGMYCSLNILLALILMISGEMNAFDAITHSFATMATGGFSNYDSSLGHFSSSFVQYTVIVFMILAGTNFTLLYMFFRGKPKAMLRDIEWQTYVLIIFGLTALIVGFGMWNGDAGFGNFFDALRNGLFQVVSVITTTGFGTNDFDQWNSFGRGALLLLMFVGGCAGSTGGGMKVVRHILFVKILRLEIEKSYRPRVVRKLTFGGKTIDDASLSKNILVYFALVLMLFCSAWLYVVAFEPSDTWGANSEKKLMDSASAVAATLNNIGPGLGTVGASQNYGHFSNGSKFLFIWLMMLGRLELYVVLVLFVPRFWRGYN